MLKLLLIGMAVISLLNFIVYGLDKHAAKANLWRTPERRLLLFGLAGGAAGGLLGMLVFHHKTRKWYFWAANLLGICWQIVACLMLSRQSLFT